MRAFRKVGGTPVFFKEARGAHVVDEDGNRYLDFCMAWGPLILGHAHPKVVEAVQRAAADGLAFGTAHRHEGELAERVLAAYPYAQLVRFVVSGTEAVATAVRIARASNGRRRILKFDGCYHGHVDSLMVKAGSGVVTQGLADSAGVPAQVAADTSVIPLGDIAALEQAFREHGKDLAAAIIEPVPANNGLLLQSQRISAEAARTHARARHGADLRRSDHRVPLRLSRLRQGGGHRARPHHAGQDRRRRPAGGGGAGTQGTAGAARAAGPGVPGRHHGG